MDEHPATALPATATAAAAGVTASPAVTRTAAVLGVVTAAAGAASPPTATRQTNHQKLVQLFGKSMDNVVIRPYDQLHEPLKSFPLGAWTMSGTLVYVRDMTTFNYTDNIHYAVLYHEGLHIQQFRKHGGRPQTYEKMVVHEVEAYAKSATWLVANWKKYGVEKVDKKVLVATWQRYAVGFRNKLKAVRAAKPQDPEPFYKDLLLGKNKLDRDDHNKPIPATFLPPHGSLSELYK